MHIKQARVINVFWSPGETFDLRALATALRGLPPGANADSIETTQDGDASFHVLHIEYTIDEASEHQRIIDEYRNYDPLRDIADIAHASRNLPTRD